MGISHAQASCLRNISAKIQKIFRKVIIWVKKNNFAFSFGNDMRLIKKTESGAC